MQSILGGKSSVKSKLQGMCDYLRALKHIQYAT